MPIFTETQRFHQWWLWSIIGAGMLIVISALLVDSSAWPVLQNQPKTG